MAIDSKHPVYETNIGLWQRCRDAYEGEDAVKAKGQLYLPKCDPGQTKQEYDAYRARAPYFEAVGRTVDGYVGAISAKAHTYTLPAEMEAFQDDATLDGIGLDEFVKLCCRDAFLVSRGGVLVDFDEETQRAYFQFYTAEQIINWADDFVVLAEIAYEPDPEDAAGIAVKAVEQLRVLRMDAGVYNVTLWRKQDDPRQTSSDWQPHMGLTPTHKGMPLGKMPFFWISSAGQTSKYTRPPLLGLVNTALSHYRSAADLEHGRHFTAMPTLYVTGMTSEEPIRVGAASAIILADPSASVGYAEFHGAGLKFLESALEMKEAQMSVLGAAAFREPKRTFESTNAVRMRMSGENTLLGSVVTSVEAALKQALVYAADWMGLGDAADIVLNREFIDTHLDPATLQGLVQAFQAGAITIETFLFNLQQSEMLQPDADLNETANELKQIAAQKAAQDLAMKTTAAKPAQSGTEDD